MYRSNHALIKALHSCNILYQSNNHLPTKRLLVFESLGAMKLMLTIFTTMVLLHVANTLNYDDTAWIKIQELLDSLQDAPAHDQQDDGHDQQDDGHDHGHDDHDHHHAHYNPELLEIVRQRVRKLRDYNHETIQMLQSVQPRPRASAQGETSFYSAGPMGLPYFIPPNSYVYLDGTEELLNLAIDLFDSHDN